MINFLKNLFNIPKRKKPEDYYQTIITKEFVRVEHPKRKTEQVFWEDIEVIMLMNTDAGPATPDIWLTLLGKNSGCLIPHGSSGFDNVYDIISKYDNFDFENVINSIRCTENEEFLLWKRELKTTFPEN